MTKAKRYPAELRERAVRMVLEHRSEYPSQWAATRSIAEKIGCTTEALRRWVQQAEKDAGTRPGLTTDERQWRSLEDVEFATLEWVWWFNYHRLLEPIGYVPPAEYEEEYYRRLEAHTEPATLNSPSLR